MRIETGLALILGTSAEKVLKSYEEYFGKIRAQLVLCDQSMQTEDLTDVLSPKRCVCLQVSCGCLLVLGQGQARPLVPGLRAQQLHEQTNPWSFAEVEETDGLPQERIRLPRGSGNAYSRTRQMAINRQVYPALKLYRC